VNYEEKIKKYIECRKVIEKINSMAKAKIAEVNKVMQSLEADITAAADAEGLDQIPTEHGTGYWSTLYSCKLASPDDFVEYIKRHDAFHLVDKRANKTAVREHLAEYGELPPGVDLSSYRKFNVREK